MAADLTVTRLAALAHGTRLSLFRLLVVAGPDGLTVGRIAEQLPIPVINPGQVAYKTLEMLIELGLSHSKKAFPTPEIPKDADIGKGWY